MPIPQPEESRRGGKATITCDMRWNLGPTMGTPATYANDPHMHMHHIIGWFLWQHRIALANGGRTNRLADSDNRLARPSITTLVLGPERQGSQASRVKPGPNADDARDNDGACPEAPVGGCRSEHNGDGARTHNTTSTPPHMNRTWSLHDSREQVATDMQ